MKKRSMICWSFFGALATAFAAGCGDEADLAFAPSTEKAWNLEDALTSAGDGMERHVIHASRMAITGCTRQEQRKLTLALTKAKKVVGTALTLDHLATGNGNFKRWFGTIDPTNRRLINKIKSKLEKTRVVLVANRFKFECSPNRRKEVTFNRNDKQKKVGIHPRFFQLPTDGRQSQAGTLIRIALNFAVPRDIGDIIEPIQETEERAATDPERAALSAQSYQYYCEDVDSPHSLTPDNACSPVQQKEINAALVLAKKMVKSAQSAQHLKRDGDAFQRWFGEGHDNRAFNTIKDNISSIKKILESKSLAFDCSALRTRTFKIDRYNVKKKVLLYTKFFHLPSRGRQSQASIFVRIAALFAKPGTMGDLLEESIEDTEKRADDNPLQATEAARNYEYYCADAYDSNSPNCSSVPLSGQWALLLGGLLFALLRLRASAMRRTTRT